MRLKELSGGVNVRPRFHLFPLLVLLASLLFTVRGIAQDFKEHDEAYELGLRLQRDWATNGITVFAELWDVESFLARVLNGLAGDAESTNVFRAMKMRFMDLRSADEFIRTGHPVHFLGVRYFDGVRQLVFMYEGIDGYEYSGLILARAPDRRLHVVDIVSFNPYQLFSHYHRLEYIFLSSMRGKPDAVTTPGRDAELFDAMSAGLSIRPLGTWHYLEGAAGVYSKLGPIMRADEQLLYSLCLKARQTDEAAMKQAIQLCRQVRPDSLTPAFIEADFYEAARLTDRMITAYGNLSVAFGGDPFWDNRQGGVYEHIGDFDKAIACYKLATTREPPLQLPFDNLIRLALARKDYGELPAVLNAKEAAFNLDLRPEVKAGAAFETFRRSGWYKDWLKMPPGQRVRIRPKIAAEIVTPPIPKLQPMLPYAKLRPRTGTAPEPIPAAPVAPVTPPPPEPKGPRLQGIMSRGDNISALISGQLVNVGDKVMGAKVLKIDRESVTLELPDGTAQILRNK